MIARRHRGWGVAGAGVMAVVAALGACADDGPDRAADGADGPPGAVAVVAGSPTDASAGGAGATDAAAAADAGDGGDSGDSGASAAGAQAPSEDDAFCGPMAEVAAADAGFDITLPWPQLQERIVESAARTSPLYDDAIALAPEAIVADLRLLDDYRQDLSAHAAAAATLADFQVAVAAATPVEDLTAATANVDAYIEEACGLSLPAG